MRSRFGPATCETTCPSRIRLHAFRIASSRALISLEQMLRLLSHPNSERTAPFARAPRLGRPILHDEAGVDDLDCSGCREAAGRAVIAISPDTLGNTPVICGK